MHLILSDVGAACDPGVLYTALSLIKRAVGTGPCEMWWTGRPSGRHGHRVLRLDSVGQWDVAESVYQASARTPGRVLSVAGLLQKAPRCALNTVCIVTDLVNHCPRGPVTPRPGVHHILVAVRPARTEAAVELFRDLGLHAASHEAYLVRQDETRVLRLNSKTVKTATPAQTDSSDGVLTAIFADIQAAANAVEAPEDDSPEDGELTATSPKPVAPQALVAKQEPAAVPAALEPDLDADGMQRARALAQERGLGVKRHADAYVEYAVGLPMSTEQLQALRASTGARVYASLAPCNASSVVCIGSPQQLALACAKLDDFVVHTLAYSLLSTPHVL